MARTFLSAKGHGDEAIKTFVNTSLGETWVETGEAPDWQRLYERRESWQICTVPSGGLFLTAGADVQKDRIEVDVWAWGRGLESWLVDHIVIDGGPEHAASWNKLSQLLGRTWLHAHGAQLGLAKLAIDTGYESPAVYAWARRAGHAQVAPIKGVEGFNRAAPVIGPTHVDVTEGGKKLRRGARLWTIAVSTFKSETYRYLRLTAPTDEEIAAGAKCLAGYVHLPNGTEAEWLKQLVGEQLVTVKTKRGFSRLEWQKLRERNEALDCRVYARAAAWIAGADRWTEAMWRNLEQQVGALGILEHEKAKAPDALSASIAGVLRRRPERRSRRLFRSSYMS
jgi:phage terminase large subunit GpA-like protein